MSTSDLFFLTLKSSLANPLNIAIAIAAFVAVVVIFYLVRWSINKKYKGGGLWAIIGAVLIAVPVFSLLGLNSADSYFDILKIKQSEVYRNDAVWRNEALSRAWTQINTAGKLNDIDSPDEGGTEIRFDNKAEAQLYTQSVAEVIEERLRLEKNAPAGIKFQSKEDVAIQIFEGNQEVDMLTFPTTINQDNSFATKCLEIRVDEFFDEAKQGVSLKAEEVGFLLKFIILSVFVVISLVLGVGGWKELLKTR